MNRHPLPEQLLRELSRFTEDRRILAAVSGGADSMALLRGLYELRNDLALELHVAHLDHQLRGAASESDALHVAHVCRVLELPCTIGRADVAGLAQADCRGIEETARDERYRFLEATAIANDLHTIALAHTADDQAETILHHILRGTGLAGLRGIPSVRETATGIRLIRPMLAVARDAILDYLAQLGQEFCDDETNRDDAYTRNRIRRQLLPQLAREYNPQISEALRRLGNQASEAQSALEFAAGDLLEHVLDPPIEDECRLKWQALAAAPRHLVREMFTKLWRQRGWSRQKMGFEHWDLLAGIALTGGAATFPGNIDVRRQGRWLVLRASLSGERMA